MFSDNCDFYDISYISYISAIARITRPYFICISSRLTSSNCIPKHFQSFFSFRHFQASPQQFYIQIRQQHTPRNPIVTLRVQFINRKYSVFPKPKFRYVKSAVVFQFVDSSASENNFDRQIGCFSLPSVFAKIVR